MKYLGCDLAPLNEEPVSRISTVILLMDHTDDVEHSEFHCEINSNKNWKFTYLLALPILGRVTATVVAPITQACNSFSVWVL